MADLAEVVQRLDLARTKLNDAAGQLAVGKQRTEQATAKVIHALGDAKVLVGYLHQISSGMDQVSDGIAAARGKLDETIAKVRELGHGRHSRPAGRATPPHARDPRQRAQEADEQPPRWFRATDSAAAYTPKLYVHAATLTTAALSRAWAVFGVAGGAAALDVSTTWWGRYKERWKERRENR